MIHVIEDPSVQERLDRAFIKAAKSTLKSDIATAVSKEFLETLAADPELQRKMSDEMWKIYIGSITPSFLRSDLPTPPIPEPVEVTEN